MNTRQIIADTLAGLTNVDSALLKTLVQLFVVPGNVCLAYVNGKRKTYLSPFRYFLIIITLFLLGHWIMGESLVPNIQIDGSNSKEVEMMATFKSLMAQYMNVILLLALPVFALQVRWLFANSGFNYAEVSCFVFYVVTQQLIFGLMLAPLKSLHPQVYMVLRVGVQVVYFAWAAKVFFASGWLASLVKSALASLLYMTTVGLVILSVVFLLHRF